MRSSRGSLHGLIVVGLALVCGAIACGPPVALRTRVSRDFHCPPHRIAVMKMGTLGPEPFDRRRELARERAEHEEFSDDDVVAFSFEVEGCDHRDHYVCSRRGARAYRCGVMIR
jgi:hypothetical protein